MKRHLAAAAALALPLLPVAALADDTTEVWWLMPEGSSPSNVGWPQQHSPSGATECERWYQVDRYPVGAIPALIADGLLHYGEDFGIALSWRFEQGPACQTEPTPEPTTEPTSEPTTQPTPEPTPEPTSEPTVEPSTEPTTAPTTSPTTEPTVQPTTTATSEPTTAPQIGRGIWTSRPEPRLSEPTATTEPPAVATTDTLADTGASGWLWPAGVTGLVLAVVGVLAVRRAGKR